MKSFTQDATKYHPIAFEKLELHHPASHTKIKTRFWKILAMPARINFSKKNACPCIARKPHIRCHIAHCCWAQRHPTQYKHIRVKVISHRLLHITNNTNYATLLSDDPLTLNGEVEHNSIPVFKQCIQEGSVGY